MYHGRDLFLPASTWGIGIGAIVAVTEGVVDAVVEEEEEAFDCKSGDRLAGKIVVICLGACWWTYDSIYSEKSPLSPIIQEY